MAGIKILIFIFIINCIMAENADYTDECISNLYPRNYVKCNNMTLLSDECTPFTPIIGLNWDTAKFGLRVLFGQLMCNGIPKESKIPSLIYLIIYRGNQTPITVNGKEFLKNPSEYIDFKAPCYKILIGGFTTYASINPYDVYKENDWITFSAKSLSCRTDCYIIVVDWGQLSGNDYSCLACNAIKPIGNFVGRIALMLDPCRVYIAGHSLGAHIGGFAGKYIKARGGLLREMAAYDAAGPLLRTNNCLWQFGFCEAGMEKCVALRTISFNTNPGGLGSANLDLGHINILCNPPYYQQPGFTISDPINDHMFGGYLCAALSAGVECTDNSYPDLNLNYNDNENIPCGTYELQIDDCFPYYC